MFNYCHDITTPSIEVLQQISDTLHIPLSYLLSEFSSTNEELLVQFVNEIGDVIIADIYKRLFELDTHSRQRVYVDMSNSIRNNQKRLLH